MCSTARTLGSGVLIPPKTLMYVGGFPLLVLSCVGSDLADPPSDGSYQLSIKLIVLRLILKQEHVRGPNSLTEEKKGSLMETLKFQI
jgi:hypothetical protein